VLTRLTGNVIQLPVEITADRVVVALALTVAMCVIAAAAAVRKLTQADPAMCSETASVRLNGSRPNCDAPVLRIRHLNFAFGQGELRKQILFDVDFDLAPGEIVILEGPSGLGKTTLLTLACGLRRFADGSVRVFGEEIRDASDKQLLLLRRRIGFVFQNQNLLPFLTARRNVEIVFRLWPNVTPKRPRRKASKFWNGWASGIGSMRIPQPFRAAQKQRVAIARAIVAQPGLVLADEPTSSLDKESGRQVVDLLRQMARSHRIPILLVTHDTRILDIADRIVRIEDGRVEFGTGDVLACQSESVYHKP